MREPREAGEHWGGWVVYGMNGEVIRGQAEVLNLLAATGSWGDTWSCL